MGEFFYEMGRMAWKATKAALWITAIIVAIGAGSHLIKNAFMLGWKLV